MSKSILSLCLVAILSNSVIALDNEWIPLGPWGGNVRDIVIDPTDPNTIYVVCFNSGLFKSSDQGRTWERKWDEVFNQGGYDIELDPRNSHVIYLSTYEGVYKSLNAGDNWQKILDKTLVLDIELNPFKPQVIIGAATGLPKSIDEGAHWEFIGFGNVSVYTVEYDPNQPHVFYVGTAVVPWFNPTSIVYGVCKTTDGGKTWSSVRQDIKDLTMVRDIQIDPRNSDKIYVVGVNERFYKEDDRYTPYRSIYLSQDGGKTFSCINNGLNVNRVDKILIDPRNTGVLYVCTDEQGLWKSSNGGNDWVSQNKGIHERSVQAIALDEKNNILYLGTSGGSLYRSLDAGETWEEICQGIFGSELRSLTQNALDPSTIYLSSGWYPWKSIDKGESWQRIGSGFLDGARISQITLDPRDSNIVYACLGSYLADVPLGVWRSADGGRTWAEKSQGLPHISYFIQMRACVAESTSNLALATTEGIFISEDGAESWEQRMTGIKSDELIAEIAFHPHFPQALYACGFQVYESLDLGQHWSVIRSNDSRLLTKIHYDLFINPHNPAEIYAGCDGDMFVSYNNGKDWSLFGKKMRDVIISPHDPQLMLAEKAEGGALWSPNKGQTWQDMNTGWHQPKIEFFQFDIANPYRVYAATRENGLFCWTFSSAAVDEKKKLNFPFQYYLGQNYPNPFNMNTTIPYHLIETESIKIEILNLTGQKVATLVDREQQRGSYSIDWDGRNEIGELVSSGVYLCTMNCKNFKATRKLLLVR